MIKVYNNNKKRYLNYERVNPKTTNILIHPHINHKFLSRTSR